MLTDDDRKYLERLVSKQGTIMQRMCCGSGIFFAFMAVIKVYLAGAFAGLDGTTFSTFVARWATPPTLNATYSGSFIKATDCMTFGLLYFGMALLYAFAWWNGRRTRQRTQRILNTLKSSGGW